MTQIACQLVNKLKVCVDVWLSRYPCSFLLFYVYLHVFIQPSWVTSQSEITYIDNIVYARYYRGQPQCFRPVLTKMLRKTCDFRAKSLNGNWKQDAKSQVAVNRQAISMSHITQLEAKPSQLCVSLEWDGGF